MTREKSLGIPLGEKQHHDLPITLLACSPEDGLPEWGEMDLRGEPAGNRQVPGWTPRPEVRFPLGESG